MENMEQTITVKDVKILETVEDIQERRDQVKSIKVLLSNFLVHAEFKLFNT